MINIFVPMWLIIFIVGLPQLSESIYSPALPAISESLATSDAMVELTLSVFLFAFAFGCLFFGKISDIWGRKPCVLLGTSVFIIGSIMCATSTSIEMLIVSRFIQAFGGSIGSVLGQAICRDAFEGPALAKVYATFGVALSLFPAIAPSLGGFIASYLGWRAIFWVLIGFATALILAVGFFLPETHNNRTKVCMWDTFKTLAKDKQVILFGILVAGCNGIAFSYYAEAPFYFIECLDVSPSLYGNSFILISLFNMLGGLYNRKQQGRKTQWKLITQSLKIMSIGAICFSIVPFLGLSKASTSILSILCQTALMFYIPVVTGNALSLALKDYKHCIGTASSIFGCFYYVIISTITIGQAALHNDTLYVMPLYFLGIIGAMILFTKNIKKS